MRLFYFFIIFTLFLSSQTVLALTVQDPAFCTINTLLKVGSRGTEVECLQGKVGALADGNFGPKTKVAVMAFQSSHMLATDGIVGPITRAALNGFIADDGNYPAGCTGITGYSITTGAKCDGSQKFPIESALPNIQSPKVFSVSPEKVRSGDIVKIYGENFASTGNTVRLRYGQIEDRFENLPSSDGKVISFVFQPPEVDIMSKEELLNLHSMTLNQLLDPVKTVGGSIEDIVTPYRNMKDENDLRKFLSNNGHSFDELYDKFYVTVENIYGHGTSSGPVLAGLRKLLFGSDLAITEHKNFLHKISSWFELITPKKAYAQIPQGGTNSGIVMYCTCGAGYLTTMVDFSANGGSGFFWWPPGFVPNVGSPAIPGPQLGFYTKNAGQCIIISGPSCIGVTANIANLPWGEGL